MALVESVATEQRYDKGDVAIVWKAEDEHFS
jgi:hypothetical protein